MRCDQIIDHAYKLNRRKMDRSEQGRRSIKIIIGNEAGKRGLQGPQVVYGGRIGTCIATKWLRMGRRRAALPRGTKLDPVPRAEEDAPCK